MNASDLDLELLAQFEVERRQRFVKEQDVGLYHDRARQRHALALAAGELGRIPVREKLQANQAKSFGDFCSAFGAPDSPYLQAKCDVLGDRLMGKQGIGLKNHASIAPIWREICDVASGHDYAAMGGRDEACDHAQTCSFAASARSQQRQKLALPDCHIHAADDELVGVRFLNVFKNYFGHLMSAPASLLRTEKLSEAYESVEQYHRNDRNADDGRRDRHHIAAEIELNRRENANGKSCGVAAAHK